MEKRDKSLLDLENKIGNINEKENVLKNMRINKPNMNMNLLNINKFNKDNLLSFLNKFKKENEKIMEDENKSKYNIENEQNEEEEDGEEKDNINNNVINLDEDEEENEKDVKNKKKKVEKIELDLLMGILEQQKKKEISILNIIENKKKLENNLDEYNKEKGEKEIIDFLTKK